jgi:hypothetical protein
VSSALAGWESTEAVGPDGRIELTQRALLSRPVVPASTEGAARLGEAYWRAVRAVTRGLVRARRGGQRVELRLLGVKLLVFEQAAPRVTDREVACTFTIAGGLLARLPGGDLTLAQEAAGPAIRSTITGYSPRLAARAGRPGWTGALYTHVQQRVHAAASRRYFRLMIDEAGA